MLIAGNWKMNLKYEDIINFKNIISDFKLDNHVEMAIFPQFPLLYSAKKYLSDHNIEIGAQACSAHLKGAYTGDVSVDIISDPIFHSYVNCPLARFSNSYLASLQRSVFSKVKLASNMY